MPRPSSSLTPAGREGSVRAKRSVLRDASPSAVLAGLIAVVVSFAGPSLVVLAAARSAQLTVELTSSWIWAISIGSGATCLLLSWITRMPVITAWSTPGAALLMTNLRDYPYPEAIGAFAIAAALIAGISLTGVFGRLIAIIPTGIVNALLAGVLFTFGASMFGHLTDAPVVVILGLATFFIAKRFTVRWAVPATLLVVVLLTLATTGLHVSLGEGSLLAVPKFTVPAFSLAATIGIAVPLAVVTLVSQNAPGIALLRSEGYKPNERLLVGGTGIASFVLAPFGSHAVNLAAITAAICTGPEAHPDPKRRYVAGMSCGIFYLIVGLFSGVLLAAIAGLPAALIAVVAGVALLGALTGSLASSMANMSTRDASVVTFVCTASGVTLFGISSAFWGLMAGIGVHVITRTSWRAPK